MTFVYLSLTLLVSVLGAFTDIRSGRVKNKHLNIALIIWLALVISEAIFNHSYVTSIFPFVLNIVLTFITALIFYLIDIWAPGDCKLFIVISIIFPFNAYIVRNGNIFPALDFVIYAFALGYVVLLINSIIRHLRGSKNADNTVKINLKNSLSVMLNTGIILFLYSMLDIFAAEFFYSNQMLCTLLIIGAACLIQKKFGNLRKILGFIGLIFFLSQSIVYNSLINACLSLIESLIIAVILEFINNRAYENIYREISQNEIRPGMILSFSTLWAMQKCIDPDLPRTTTENRRSRLTERQAEAVKTWCRNARSNVIIVEMMPFAPFLAGAVLIQILRFLCLRG